MKFLGILCLLFSSLNLNAAVIAGTSSKIDSQKRTHIIVVGMADKLGDLFFKSAETKAKLIKEIFPDDQIILLATNDEKEYIARSIFKKIDFSRGALKDSTIESVVDKVSSIASIDIIAHSNAIQGAILDKSAFTGYPLGEDSKLWDAVKPKLNKKSYVMIHGCNAAVKTAPLISKKLGVAVLGALTSTDFQFVYQDSRWAHDYEATSLKKSSDKRVRMKPDNFSYRGHWGDWREGGFPTYKTFCGDLDSVACGESALSAIDTYPSVVHPKDIKSEADFKKNIYDFLCPFNEKNNLFNECVEKLEASLVTNENDFYSPFKGPTLNCSFERCEAYFECSLYQMTVKPETCKLVNENKSPSDAFVQEFKFYIEAFKQKMSKEGSNE